LLHLVGSSILLYLIDDARSNKNHVCYIFILGVSYTTYEDGTGSWFRNIGTYISKVVESPKRKNATFRPRRKFKIKNIDSANEYILRVRSFIYC